MNKRNRIIFWSVAVLAILGLTVWLLTPSAPPDPVYNGHLLSYWVTPVPGFNVDPWGNYYGIRLPGVPGLQMRGNPQLDSNAVPYLIHCLKTRDGVVRKIYIHLYPHLPVSLRIHLNYPVPAALRVAVASRFLVKLGPTARQAIPELIRMLNPADKRRCQENAMHALSMMANQDHAAVIDALRAATKASDPDVRVAAEMALERLDPPLVL